MKDKLIKTEDYLLVVSDEIIKDVRPYIGRYHLEQGHMLNQFPSYLTDLTECKLIIAHLPLREKPILEGVYLLPPFEEDIKKEDIKKMAKDWLLENGWSGHAEHSIVKSWMAEFYNKAKETYKYTEEDLRKAIDMATTCKHESTLLFFNANEIIQSLNQPKFPIAFECETIIMNKGYTDKSDFPYQEVRLPKTTTNSEGRTEWVGKYIFN